MAPLSLKIILDDGAITRTMMFDTSTRVREAGNIARDKILTLDPNKEYGFFLASADNDCSGVWLDDGDKTLDYYMLRDGDSLHYLLKIRNLRLRMLDGAVKTLQLDESKKVVELMVYICEKLRISHSEEYGLCREQTDTEEDSKNATGTLTLKKKTIQREKDAKLEQLSKKLKTDDLVEWLDQHKTLKELKVEPQETLLFKRRLFYSDRNVDSRDPVQLNLLYVQTRDGILEGKQVVTETKAVEFAGLQCQIQFGDYQEEKHKPGYIQTMKEFLPEQYVSWGVEKKTIKEHKKHIGVPEIEAKHLYTKMARELPTYGVTFFLVKEKQVRKKKLVPRLLGINAQSILRLDEETKEIIQVWLLTQVKSYRADYESFALNFGDYSEKEYVVKTNEGFRIKDILEGYIDIIKRSLAAPRKVNFTEGEAMFEENVERSRGTTIQNYAASKMIESSLVGPSQIISIEQEISQKVFIHHHDYE